MELANLARDRAAVSSSFRIFLYASSRRSADLRYRWSSSVSPQLSLSIECRIVVVRDPDFGRREILRRVSCVKFREILASSSEVLCSTGVESFARNHRNVARGICRAPPYWIVIVVVIPTEAVAVVAVVESVPMFPPPLVGAVQCFASNITSLIRFIVCITTFRFSNRG